MHAGRWVVALIVAAAVALAWTGFALRRASAPRSVVLVTIDTLRADRLGWYGRSPTITPALDALAARGVVFERAWTTAPLTVPAHASLLTGLLPPKHGLRLNRPVAPLPRVEDRRFFTLAEALKEKGYATGAFVSASVLAREETGLDAGFDVYDEVPRAAPGVLFDNRRPGEETVAKCLDWLKSQSGPAFVWVHLFDPHAPYDAPAGFGAGKDHASDATGYDAAVAYADHCVGRLLAGLESAGLGDAVVAVVSDHGESLGEHGEPTHGYLLHEATLRVPLIVSAPGLAPARRADVVSVVDVFSTLLSLAGHPIPPQANQRPLFDAKSALAETERRPVYAESLYAWDSFRWAQVFAWRVGDEKLVACGAEPMVFHLATDPGEDRAGAPDESQRAELAELTRFAREPALGSMTPGATPEPSGSYWSTGSAGVNAVLPDEENAKLPSPYDRMDVLRRLNLARTLLSVRRNEEALAEFDEVARLDPANPESAFWRGRTLEALKRHAEAAESCRRAFELGFRSPTCVAKALALSLIVLTRADLSGTDKSAESDRADRFLAVARGKGFRDDSQTFVMEAFLRLARSEFDRCDEALRRAESLPHDARTQGGIDQCREDLVKAREQAPK